MPRLRRASATSREVNFMMAIFLFEGFDFFNEISEDERRATWELNREWMLAEYIAMAPTTRPSAWWDYDSPGPRKCISGPGAWCMRDPDAPEWTRKLYFGRPGVSCYEDVKHPSAYESQVEYLNRLDLLEQSEVDYLDALAASPDPTYHEPEFCTRNWRDQRQEAAE